MTTFYDLVFGDDFSFIWIRWMSHVVFFVSGSSWHPPHLWRVRRRLLKSPWRSRKYGHSLAESVKSIRIFLSNGMLYSKHFKLNSFKFCYKMIQVWNLVKAFTRIFPSLDYIGQQLELQFYSVQMCLSEWLGGLIMRVEPFSTLRINM